jgi:hypothetical protein
VTPTGAVIVQFIDDRLHDHGGVKADCVITAAKEKEAS